ncbi:hypothetical protein F4703DRAFT_1757766 [Phycomyces blakesleeanus]
MYDFKSSDASWKEIFAINNATGPPIRLHFTLTPAPNGKVYIYGGSELYAARHLNDFWSFDPLTLEYKNLTLSNQPYRGDHTATALPNGQIVYIGGIHSNTSGDYSSYLSPNVLEIYDTNTNEWIYINATGEKLAGSSGPGSVLGPDKKTIILYGGGTMSGVYLNDILLLDTTTWVWSRPNIPGDYPDAMYTFNMGFIGENLLAITHDMLSTFPYSDISVLSIEDQKAAKYKWLSGPEDLPELDTVSNIQSKMTGGVIAGITVGAVLLVIILGFCIWKTSQDVYCVPRSLGRFIWGPRGGEPVWIELFRKLIQCILVFLFLAYAVFSIRQALNSPTTSIIISTKVSSVSIPDMRFCFEGYNIPGDPRTKFDESDGVIMTCGSDTGVSCDQFMTKLDMKVHLPVFGDSVTASDCYLFSPPSWFLLGTTGDGNRNGTKLHIKMFGGIQLTGTIRMTQYPPGMDPNVKVYKINSTDVPLVMSDQDVNEWAVRDMQGKSDSNTFTMYTNNSMNFQYQIKDHQYLTDSGWNQIGFLPLYNHTSEITSAVQANNFDIHKDIRYAENDLIIGFIDLYPVDYLTIVEQEQKIHTILNSLGSVGGIISLMAFVQAWMFGFRPNSPWGVVQRWSCGCIKRSLGRNLRKKFGALDTPVPFVSPVNSRFVDTEKMHGYLLDESEIGLLRDQQDRNFKALQDRQYVMERRMQLMERLLESYYVDTEVFKELDLAIGHHKRNSSSSTIA